MLKMRENNHLETELKQYSKSVNRFYSWKKIYQQMFLIGDEVVDDFLLFFVFCESEF